MTASDNTAQKQDAPAPKAPVGTPPPVRQDPAPQKPVPQKPVPQKPVPQDPEDVATALPKGLYDTAFASEHDLGEQVRVFRMITRTLADQKRMAGRKLYARLQRSGNAPLLRHFLLAFNAYDTEYEYVRFSGDKSRHAASFRVAMSTRTRRMKELGRHTCPEWMVWDKPEGARFTKVLGLEVPQQHMVGPLSDLPLRAGTVIKPVDANHGDGVYLIFSEDRIGDATTGRFFSGFRKLKTRLRRDLKQGKVREDRWIVEDLVQNPSAPKGLAADWKFYCFYGHVVMICHSLRFPRMADIWFGPDGTPKELGFDIGRKSLPVPDIPERMIETARQISLSIPAPFLRVDLLDNGSSAVVGEFTARPFFWRRFGRKMDLEMGDAFIAAEARLQADLLAGKEFAAWKVFAKDSPYQPPPPEPAAPNGPAQN